MTANVIESFKSAIYDSLGYVPEHIQADGMLHRIKDNDGKMNGAYVLHLDNRPGGYFQCFKQGIKQTWKMTGNFIPLSNYQRQVFRSQCQKES